MTFRKTAKFETKCGCSKEQEISFEVCPPEYIVSEFPKYDFEWMDEMPLMTEFERRVFKFSGFTKDGKLLYKEYRRKEMKKKIIISETQPPSVGGSIYSWVRGKDPWHSEAFPTEFQHIVGSEGERQSGWLGVDWCGNVIDWCPDGTEREVKNETL